MIFNQNPEIIIAFASVFIAAFSLFVTVWQGMQNYKHNKLSVKPYLCVSNPSEIDGKFGFIEYNLMNAGIGPAKIKSFILFDGDKELYRDNEKQIREYLEAKLIGCKTRTIGIPLPGYVIPQNENDTLLSFEYDTEKLDVEFLNKINIVIEYQSIYEKEIFTYKSKDDRKYHGR